MAKKLGSLFINAAIGPLNAAGHSIMARRVAGGLAELDGQFLLAAVVRGIANVADVTGLPRKYVANMLPMAELQTVADRIAANQRTAVQQWDVHTGHVGGLLEGVADLTIDMRPPDASLCLLRVSRKMQMDKALRVPLQELSEDLDLWRQMLETCRVLIDDGHSLRNAYRQRRVLRLGVAAAALLAFAIVGVWVARVKLARGRVATIIEMDDPCAVETIADPDLAKASGKQEQQVSERRESCHQRREQERRVEEERRLEEERRQAEERKRQARLDACTKIAKDVVDGGPVDTTAIDAGQHGPLLQRIAMGKLEPTDVTSDLASLPCTDTEASAAIGAAYGRAAFASAGMWMTRYTLSNSARELIIKGKAGLGQREGKVFAQHVETLAKKSLRTGDDESIARAKVLCELKEALELPVRQHCRAAISL